MLYEFISQRYRILLTKLGTSKLDYGMEFDLFEKQSSSKAVKLAWDNTEASLLKMRSLCESRSAEFYVVYLPKREQINHWENVIKFYKANADNYDRFITNHRLQTFCNDKHIYYFDVVESTDARPDKEEFYYKFDSHLTPKGNQAFFDIFYKKIAPYLDS